MRISACVLLLSQLALAASKPHVVALGKWTSVKWFSGEDDSKAIDMKVRPLVVDGRTKEFTTGAIHDITDRMFAVQRAYRINDLLPQETGSIRWRWERGGWMLVDRISGKVQSLVLPAFDPVFSNVSWFRDYAAYCGVSDDGKKIFTVVAQIGKRKPLLKTPVEDKSDDAAAAACPAPTWLSPPARVTFEPAANQKFTFTVRSHAVDLVTEDEDEDGE